MNVLLRPGVLFPGAALDVEARFESETETPVDEIYFELKGIERLRIPHGKSQLTREHTHVHLRADHPATTFTPGTHVRHARFQLPKDLPPRYSGSFAWVDYTLEVRASIPWWPDAVGRYEVPVAPVRVPAPVTPGVFVSRAGGPLGGELYGELSLASTIVEAGGELVGTVAFTNIAKERAVRISLIALEHVFSMADFWQGGNVDEMREVKRWSFTPAEGVPADGAPVPFRFAIAPGTMPSYSGMITSLLWVVEVSVQGLILSRPLIRAPITIAPPTGAPRPQPSQVPAVGLARRAQSLQRVAERARLAYDEVHPGIHGGVGSVSLHVHLGAEADGSPTTVARLTWPSLGMALRVAPSSWTDAFTAADIDVGLPIFDGRFTVESRVAEQVRALLDREICELLLTFDEARAGDDGAVLLVRMGLLDEEPLGGFVDRAVRLARAFDRAFDRVPPPPELLPHVDAWRAFADRIGGRFEAGRGAVLDGTVGLERLDIATLWAPGGQLQGTELRVPLGARIDPAAISPAARAIVASIEEPGARALVLTDDTLSLRVPTLTADPAELDPLIESLVRLAHAVRGRGAAGPFRT